MELELADEDEPVLHVQPSAPNSRAFQAPSLTSFNLFAPYTGRHAVDTRLAIPSFISRSRARSRRLRRTMRQSTSVPTGCASVSRNARTACGNSRSTCTSLTSCVVMVIAARFGRQALVPKRVSSVTAQLLTSCPFHPNGTPGTRSSARRSILRPTRTNRHGPRLTTCSLGLDGKTRCRPKPWRLTAL